jgi:hypothetical protein
MTGSFYIAHCVEYLFFFPEKNVSGTGSASVIRYMGRKFPHILGLLQRWRIALPGGPN